MRPLVARRFDGRIVIPSAAGFDVTGDNLILAGGFLPVIRGLGFFLAMLGRDHVGLGGVFVPDGGFVIGIHDVRISCKRWRAMRGGKR